MGGEQFERREGHKVILLKLEGMEKKQDEFGEKINHIEEILNGNGEPGIVAITKSNQIFIQNLDKFHREVRQMIIGAVITIVVTMILAAGSIVFKSFI